MKNIGLFLASTVLILFSQSYGNFSDYNLPPEFLGRIYSLKQAPKEEDKQVKQLIERQIELNNHFLFQTAEIRASDPEGLLSFLKPDTQLEDSSGTLITSEQVDKGSRGEINKVLPALESFALKVKKLSDELYRRQRELPYLESRIPLLYSGGGAARFDDFVHPDYRKNKDGQLKNAEELEGFVRDKIELYNSICETLGFLKIPHYRFDEPFITKEIFVEVLKTVFPPICFSSDGKIFLMNSDCSDRVDNLVVNASRAFVNLGQSSKVGESDITHYFQRLLESWQRRLPLTAVKGEGQGK